MKVEATCLNDAKLIYPTVFGDERGFFSEVFQSDRYLKEAGCHVDFVQDNWSRSTKGVLRGLHFQHKHPQGKLITVIRGCIFDVIVDIRAGSSTFGQWQSFELSDQKAMQLWIPPGFAHGFCVLSDEADFYYKCTAYYDPQSECTIQWNDADIGIEWPLDVTPVLSEKDKTGTPFSQIPAAYFQQ